MEQSSAVVLYDVDNLTKLGRLLAASGFFGDSTKEAQAVVKVLAGRELGLAPVASMRGIHIIQGTVAIGAAVMATLIKQSGRYNYVVRVLDDEQCELEITDNGKAIGVSKFTLADAKKANLVGGNWAKYPRNMLFARAVSNAARWYCPDVFGGAVYTPDELGAATDERGDVVESTAREVPATATGKPVAPPIERIAPVAATDPPKRPSMVEAAVEMGATVEDTPSEIRTEEQAKQITALLKQHGLRQRWLVEQDYTLPLTRAMADEAIVTLEAMANA